jgi:hypothetical protein
LSTVYFRFSAGAPLERAPLLERLLVCADSVAESADWRAQAFSVIAPDGVHAPAPASAAARCGAGDELRTWGLLATPVQFAVGMTSVSLPLDGILTLEPDETATLLGDFERVFGRTGAGLVRGRDPWLLCTFEAPLRAETSDPERALGHDLWSFLPTGADAGRVRLLMTEIEMWLHGHPLNALREARKLPAINGLWLWGGGPTDTPLPAVEGWTAGVDPLFSAFGPRTQYPEAGGAGVVVIEDSPGAQRWPSAEQTWLLPALAELRAGRLERLDLSAGNRCFSVSASGRRRFWRRARPWWTFFRAE